MNEFSDKQKNFFHNFIILLVLGFVSLFLFFLMQKFFIFFGISIFKSCLLSSLVISILVSFFYYISMKYRVFDCLVIMIAFFSSFMLFSITTYIYIDRSLTYHMTFLAAQKEKITVEDLDVLFNSDIYKKQRIIEMEESDFLIKDFDGNYKITRKGKYFSKIMLVIGKFLGVDSTWKSITKSIQEETSNE